MNLLKNYIIKRISNLSNNDKKVISETECELDDIIEKWKTKNTKYYNNAINTWTNRDVIKRSIAKENKLKYIEVWNIEELKDILNNGLENYNFT